MVPRSPFSLTRVSQPTHGILRKLLHDLTHTALSLGSARDIASAPLGTAVFGYETWANEKEARDVTPLPLYLEWLS